jgi:hypothetical protein
MWSRVIGDPWVQSLSLRPWPYTCSKYYIILSNTRMFWLIPPHFDCFNQIANFVYSINIFVVKASQHILQVILNLRLMRWNDTQNGDYNNLFDINMRKTRAVNKNWIEYEWVTRSSAIRKVIDACPHAHRKDRLRSGKVGDCGSPTELATLQQKVYSDSSASVGLNTLILKYRCLCIVPCYLLVDSTWWSWWK